MCHIVWWFQFQVFLVNNKNYDFFKNITRMPEQNKRQDFKGFQDHDLCSMYVYGSHSLKMLLLTVI